MKIGFKFLIHLPEVAIDLAAKVTRQGRTFEELGVRSIVGPRKSIRFTRNYENNNR